MRELMLEVYEVCIEAVARYEGHVTKYLGDGILGQFGYPIAHEDDARRAVLASLAVLDAVGARAAAWEARFGAPVTVRIGSTAGSSRSGRSTPARGRARTSPATRPTSPRACRPRRSA